MFLFDLDYFIVYMYNIRTCIQLYSRLLDLLQLDLLWFCYEFLVALYVIMHTFHQHCFMSTTYTLKSKLYQNM